MLVIWVVPILTATLYTHITNNSVCSNERIQRLACVKSHIIAHTTKCVKDHWTKRVYIHIYVPAWQINIRNKQ